MKVKQLTKVDLEMAIETMCQYYPKIHTYICICEFIGTFIGTEYIQLYN